MRAKVDEVYERLRVAQQNATNAMHPVSSGGIDISEMVKASRERVSGKTFKEALLAFTTIVQPTEFAKATKKAQELMERFPLQGIMGGVKIDRDGRVVAHRTVALGLGKAEAEQALWERVVEQVAMSYQIDVQAAIVPALNQLMFEHAPSLRDMRELVVQIPLSRLVMSSCTLKDFFPACVGIIRLPSRSGFLNWRIHSGHLLATAGFEVTRRDKHGIQSVIQMGSMLSTQEQSEPIWARIRQRVEGAF